MFVNDLRFQVYLHLWLLHISYYIDELYYAEIISFEIKLARDFECRDKNVKSVLIDMFECTLYIKVRWRKR